MLEWYMLACSYPILSTPSLPRFTTMQHAEQHVPHSNFTGAHSMVCGTL